MLIPGCKLNVYAYTFAEYYNNSCYSGLTIVGTFIPVNPIDAMNPLSWMTLHDFFHDEVALAAMGDIEAGLMVASKAGNYYFGPIAVFFVAGSGLPLLHDYINDAHHPFTYYTAVKLGLFNT